MARNSYAQLLRVVAIFTLLKKKKYIKKYEIQEKIYEKFGEVSDRTIDRDLEELRNEFGLVINYKRPDGFYLDVDSFQDVQKIENTFHLINSTMFKVKHGESNDFIQSDTSIDAIGNEFLDDFYKAISTKVKVKIRYNSFIKDAYDLEISPFILKEYRQRWYVAAYNENNERRVYSLDRIEYLNVLEDSPQDKNLDRSNIFKDLIGVSLAYNKTEKVILKFNKSAKDYIKTRPLHKSQQIIEEEKDSLKVELNVVVNWELEELLRGHGSNVVVIQPLSLQTSVTSALRDALKNYD